MLTIPLPPATKTCETCETCKTCETCETRGTTLFEADRVLGVRPRSQSDGVMAQAGLYYTALPHQPARGLLMHALWYVVARSVIVGAARACETLVRNL